jgi:hypothetical protein
VTDSKLQSVIQRAVQLAWEDKRVDDGLLLLAEALARPLAIHDRRELHGYRAILFAMAERYDEELVALEAEYPLCEPNTSGHYAAMLALSTNAQRRGDQAGETQWDARAAAVLPYLYVVGIVVERCWFCLAQEVPTAGNQRCAYRICRGCVDRAALDCTSRGLLLLARQPPAVRQIAGDGCPLCGREGTDVCHMVLGVEHARLCETCVYEAQQAFLDS